MGVAGIYTGVQHLDQDPSGELLATISETD